MSKAILQQKKGNVSDEELLKIIEKKPKDVRKETGTSESKQFIFNRSSHVINLFKGGDGIELRVKSASSIPHAVSNQDREEVYQQVLKRYKP